MSKYRRGIYWSGVLTTSNTVHVFVIWDLFSCDALSFTLIWPLRFLPYWATALIQAWHCLLKSSCICYMICKYLYSDTLKRNIMILVILLKMATKIKWSSSIISCLNTHSPMSSFGFKYHSMCFEMDKNTSCLMLEKMIVQIHCVSISEVCVSWYGYETYTRKCQTWVLQTDCLFRVREVQDLKHYLPKYTLFQVFIEVYIYLRVGGMAGYCVVFILLDCFKYLCTVYP